MSYKNSETRDECCFVHPEVLLTQNSVCSSNNLSQNYNTLDTSKTSTSLFGSEEMDNAFREYWCKECSPERMYREYEDELKKIEEEYGNAPTTSDLASVVIEDTEVSFYSKDKEIVSWLMEKPEKNFVEKPNKKEESTKKKPKGNKERSKLKSTNDDDDHDKKIRKASKSWRQRKEETKNNRNDCCTSFSITSSKKEQMLWLRNERNVGVYVMCDKCKKYRYLKDTTDPVDLPDKWYCYMNPDPEKNNCSIPEEKIPPAKQKEMIHNKYNAGSIVYAKISNFPWWPAMVEDNPEYLTYFICKTPSSLRPLYYHVNFFCQNGITETAWIHVKQIKPFRKFRNDYKVNALKPQQEKYKSEIKAAKKMAMQALKLTTIERLNKFGIKIE